MTQQAISVPPAIFQALKIASALRLYALHGIKANRSYTPKNMIAAASKITSQAFKPRDYMKAAVALTAWCEEQRS